MALLVAFASASSVTGGGGGREEGCVFVRIVPTCLCRDTILALCVDDDSMSHKPRNCFPQLQMIFSELYIHLE